jgi:hypothetical protein
MNNYLIGIFMNCFNVEKQKGSNGITKTPLYMGGRRGFTPYRYTIKSYQLLILTYDLALWFHIMWGFLKILIRRMMIKGRAKVDGLMESDFFLTLNRGKGKKETL